jgi:AAA ATPase domain
MQILPFQKVREIERMLDDVEIEDLIAVFSQTDGNQYLLIYNVERLPAIRGATRQARRLAEIKQRPADYADFDGPLVGLSAIDLILPDVTTHGVNFYSLEHIFYRRQKHITLRQTSYRLAQTLLAHLEALPATEREHIWQRGSANVIRLALPTLLAEQPIENLVAVLPDQDLHAYLDQRQHNYQLVYNDVSQPHDVDILREQISNSDAQWIVALEEICLFKPWLGWKPERFIDLRPVLRQIGPAQVLGQTCGELARRCWRAWQESGKQQLRATAYALAAECWLVDEDVEDLIALFPHQEFECFVETGNALRVYRVPKPRDSDSSSATGLRCHIEDLLTGQCVKIENASALICFPILEQVLRRPDTSVVLDLGPILRNAHQVTELARTFWLLSRDLLERPRPAWRPISVWVQISAEPAAITDLAVRAALIYGLSDPWQWRQSRYALFLRDCYTHVSACLLSQEQYVGTTPLAHYFRALRAWYGCSTADDPIRNMSTMLQECRIFRASSQGRGDLQEERQTAKRLIDIGEGFVLADGEIETRHQEWNVAARKLFEIDAYLRDAMDSRTPLSVPSIPFKQWLLVYHTIHGHWREVQKAIGSSHLPREKMDRILADYRRQQHIAFVPAHEQAVLIRAYQDDIERINRFKKAAETGAFIKITLRSPWVTLGVRETLRFEVENFGDAVAGKFRLRLDRSSEFEFLSPLTTLPFETVAPGRRYPLEYKIRVRKPTPTVTLSLNYSYHDHRDQQHVESVTIRLEIHQPQKSATKPKGNPYEAGRPVAGSRNFFGRQNELENILTRFVRGSTQPILLHGPRRMGKTSLLHRLERVLKDPQKRRQLGLSPELEIQLGTIHPVFVSIQSVSHGGQDYIAGFLQSIIEDICAAVGIAHAVQVKPSNQLSPTRTFMQQVDEIFAQLPRERLLVLIDEWDEIYRKEYSELGRNLRFLMQEEQRISWVFSSTWVLSKEGSMHGSPFYNQLLLIKLKEMDWNSAVQLVTMPSSEVGVDWHGEAVVAILEQTGRRPYLMQLLCSTILDHLTEKNTNVVDMATVAAAINQLITQARATRQYFGSIWNDDGIEGGGANGVHWMGRLILWALDTSSAKALTRLGIRNAIEGEFRRRAFDLPKQAFFEREFDDQITQLQWVFDAIVLEDKLYTFSIPIIRRWLHEMIVYQEDFVEQAHAGLIQDSQRPEDDEL